MNSLAARARIEDVAAAAGVSPATVSRSFNNPQMVRAALRERIELAAKSLNYFSNGAARSLASRRSLAVGAVIPTLTNTIFAEGIAAFQARLEAQGYTLVLASSEYDAAKEYKKARLMVERGVDGLMLVGAAHDPRLLDLLSLADVPFVQAWVASHATPHATIGYDNAKAAACIAEYVLGLGHRDIALVVGATTHNDRVAARIAGTVETFARHGIVLPPERILCRPYSLEAGRDAFRELRSRGPLPSLLMGGNDTLACGLLIEAQAQGIAVPEQLSIAGFGEHEIAAHITPGLTTVRLPKARAGELAAEFLLQRIDGQAPALPGNLPFELIIRGSTGPAPGVASGRRRRRSPAINPEPADRA